jgi:hypothetical protein
VTEIQYTFIFCLLFTGIMGYGPGDVRIWGSLTAGKCIVGFFTSLIPLNVTSTVYKTWEHIKDKKIEATLM